jgi:hypothetical protein
MPLREPRLRPLSWKEHRPSIRPAWMAPLHGVEWACQWLAYFLSRWAFLEVLEYLGILSVLFGVIFYCAEAGERRKQKQYQAWQVINTAQGKGGSGGRIEALQDLNGDGIPLIGVNVADAFLQGIKMRGAKLDRADFESVDARDSVFARAGLSFANLRSSNFRNSDLSSANLQHADLDDADLTGGSLAGANLTGTSLDNVDLVRCDLRGIVWRNIKSIQAANIYGVRNAPAGFVEWAQQHGAVSAAPQEDEKQVP